MISPKGKAAKQICLRLDPKTLRDVDRTHKRCLGRRQHYFSYAHDRARSTTIREAIVKGLLALNAELDAEDKANAPKKRKTHKTAK